MSIIGKISSAVHKAVDKVTHKSETHKSSESSESSKSKSSKESSSSSSTHHEDDRVSLSERGKKESDRQRVEDERDAELQELEEERQAREKALEEERLRKEEELRQEEIRRQQEIEKKKLSDEQKAAEVAALKAEIEAKKEALKAEIAAKKQAVATEIDGRKAAVNAAAAQEISEITGPTLPANFNEMTPEEQYNYLKDVTVAMAGGDESAWKTGDKELNLIGIRSWQNGQAGSAEGNKYNDTIYAVRLNNGKPEIYAFNGTVDAGIDPGGTGYGYTDPATGQHGFSHLADGYYPDGTFATRGGGKWGVETSLGQNADVRINADFNNDGVIQDNERINKTEGAGWGIFFHPGGSGENVGSWSAGCQVIRPDQYPQFMQLVKENPDNTFGYTLVDSKNLPQVDSDHVAVGVPNTSPIANGTGGTSYTGSNLPVTGSTSGYATSAPTGYVAPPSGYGVQDGAPYGASAPVNPMGVNPQDVDAQLIALCEAAIKEMSGVAQSQAGGRPGIGAPGGIGALVGNGNGAMSTAMMTLYFAYAQVITQKISIKPETEQMVMATLAKGGIDANQMKQTLTANAAATTANTGTNFFSQIFPTGFVS